VVLFLCDRCGFCCFLTSSAPTLRSR
jgi:uncharacterized cysteine cluster protein YcgN (CxxCxxCC family)